MYKNTFIITSSFVFRVFSPSRGLHANIFSFQHFPPQEPVHWVNASHIQSSLSCRTVFAQFFLGLPRLRLPTTTMLCLMHPSFHCTMPLPLSMKIIFSLFFKKTKLCGSKRNMKYIIEMNFFYSKVTGQYWILAILILYIIIITLQNN